VPLRCRNTSFAELLIPDGPKRRKSLIAFTTVVLNTRFARREKKTLPLRRHRDPRPLVPSRRHMGWGRHRKGGDPKAKPGNLFERDNGEKAEKKGMAKRDFTYFQLGHRHSRYNDGKRRGKIL